jgi:hypothetical protein
MIVGVTYRNQHVRPIDQRFSRRSTCHRVHVVIWPLKCTIFKFFLFCSAQSYFSRFSDSSGHWCPINLSSRSTSTVVLRASPQNAQQNRQQEPKEVQVENPLWREETISLHRVWLGQARSCWQEPFDVSQEPVTQAPSFSNRICAQDVELSSSSIDALPMKIFQN